MIIENPLPNMYFIPLNCYHTLEYYYLNDTRINYQSGTRVNSHMNSHVNSHPYPNVQIQNKKSKNTRQISNINIVDLECSICLEPLNLTNTDSIVKKLTDCCGLKKILKKINLCYQSQSEELELSNLELLECSHVFHSKCIGQWYKIKQHCPLCRQNAY